MRTADRPRGRSLLRLAAAALVAAALALVPAGRASAQPQQGVQVIPPAGGDTLRSVTPTFTLQATGTTAGPLRFRFELASSDAFSNRLLDTAIVTRDTTLTVRPTRALPGGARVYWRATVTDPAGRATGSPVDSRVVPPWVRPIQPAGFSGTVVYTRRPTLVWSSPQVGEPPGPWQYEIEVSNLGRTVLRTTPAIRDTALELPELETNAAYNWTVTATLPGSGQQQSFVAGRFTVFDSLDTPTATIVYQNFPNPFPSATRRATCIWVDIAQPTRATLEIFTLRGVRVRRLLPNPEVGVELGARRYGRETPGSGRGCDPNFEWDGTDDGGTRLPAGVYLLRFRGDGVEIVKKLVFRG